MPSDIIMFSIYRYRCLRKSGYIIDTIISVNHIDDLFSNPPVIYKKSAKLIMRKGMKTHQIWFRTLNVDQLEQGLLEDAKLHSS